MRKPGSGFEIYVNNLCRSMMTGQAGQQLTGQRNERPRVALVLHPYEPSYGIAGAFEALRRRTALAITPSA